MQSRNDQSATVLHNHDMTLDTRLHAQPFLRVRKPYTRPARVSSHEHGLLYHQNDMASCGHSATISRDFTTVLVALQGVWGHDGCLGRIRRLLKRHGG